MSSGVLLYACCYRLLFFCLVGVVRFLWSFGMFPWNLLTTCLPVACFARDYYYYWVWFCCANQNGLSFSQEIFEQLPPSGRVLGDLPLGNRTTNQSREFPTLPLCFSTAADYRPS